MSHRYVRISGASDRTQAVIRLVREPHDVRVEVWRRGQWVMENSYARYFILGEPDGDDVTEEEALRCIEELEQRRVSSP